MMNQLRKLVALSGYHTHAHDGEISQPIEVFFDDRIGQCAVFTE
jgi:hypothetical protein